MIVVLRYLSFAAALFAFTLSPLSGSEGSAHPPADAAPHTAPAHPSEAPTGEDQAAPSTAPGTPLRSFGGRVSEMSPEEIESALRIGEAKTAQGDYEAANIAYRQVLDGPATREQDRTALLGLARMHRKKGELTRAAAVYEKLIKDYTGDSILPTVYLELGRTHRALGAHKLAISRFYSVINSTLKMPEEGTETYRQLARTAQFEVAETYFLSGDYEQASRFFSRLKLLDLAPVDRARAHFKSVYALTFIGDHEKAVSGLRAFLELHPDDEHTPEARYLLSVSLRRLGRAQESLASTLDLLRTENARSEADQRRWIYWQRKTGNQLANEFYEQGDFNSALVIYQSLSELSPEPAWRLSVTYQIGLCYERLRQIPKARDAYTTIVQGGGDVHPSPSSGIDATELVTMANWRLKHLDWIEKSDVQIATFFQEKPAVPATSAAPPPTTPRS